MSFHELLKRNLLTIVHPTVCRSHCGSVIRITLIDKVLDECSHIELLILGHLGDFLSYLDD